jgi:hypothetical protein
MANTKDELIDKENDNRDKGELIPPKKKEPVDPNKREILTD